MPLWLPCASSGGGGAEGAERWSNGSSYLLTRWDGEGGDLQNRKEGQKVLPGGLKENLYEPEKYTI